MSKKLEGCNILVVEDNYLLAVSVSEFLEESGATVVAVSSRLCDAQAFIEQHAEELDAVVLDVNLREGDSYPLADQLIAERIPFVFSTGYDTLSINPKYRQFPLCRKPYLPATLCEAVATVRRRA